MSSERLGVIGVGYVGLVTAACFAQSGYDVTCLDIDEAKLARLRAGETPIHEPGMREVLAGSRERLTFTSSAAELFARADIAFVCVDTPPSASGDADLSRVESVLEAIPAGTTNAVLVMKSTVPPGTGARLRRALDERGLTGVAYASNPEFLREGSAIKDFLHPDRVVVGADEPAGGARRRPLPGLRRLGADHRRHLGGDDQARLERVPGDQDLVHQRDRERLRGGRRERRRGCPRHGPRCPHRVELPAAGPGLRRLLLPQGRCRAQAAGRQQRLPLPAAERRDRGQRAAEAPRRRQAQAPPGLAARPPHRALGPGVQARHRRHARGLERRARRAADRRGRRGRRLRPRRLDRSRPPRSCRAGSSSPTAPWPQQRTPTPS